MRKIFVFILSVFYINVTYQGSINKCGLDIICSNGKTKILVNNSVSRVKRQFSLEGKLPFGNPKKYTGNIKVILPSVEHLIANDYKREHQSLTTIQGNENINKLNVADKQIDSIKNYNKYRPIVVTAEGLVRGLTIEKKGLKYYSFLGMPYAEKPERFQVPKKLKPWNGIKELIEESPNCIQKNVFDIIGGSEDCLFLNIHTQTLEDKKLPVIVWIHGGIFKRGSGNLYFGPEKIIKQNVVYVSINYRLGALGFLSTGTKHAPGNMGLKDVVESLRWINRNIHMFGGDTYNVCLYGISSGGAVAEYLQLSPLANGLFAKIISHSGSTLSPWSYSPNPLKYAFELGSYLGIDTIEIDELMNHLKNVTADSIIRATIKMEMKEIKYPDYAAFVPCAEKKIPGEDMFLDDHPENILKTGNYTQVPIMIGFNDFEGLYLLKLNDDVPKFIHSIDQKIEYLLPSSLISEKTTPRMRNDIIKKVRTFYFKNQPIGMKNIRDVTNFIGDVIFLNGVIKSTKIRAQNIQYPIYFYEFAYDGKLSLLNNINISGVGHAEDVYYVFDIPILQNKRDSNTISVKVAHRTVTMLTNFAKYGNPTPAITDLITIKWNPLQDKDTFNYLRMTETIEMKNHPYKNRTDFWEEMYLNYG